MVLMIYTLESYRTSLPPSDRVTALTYKNTEFLPPNSHMTHSSKISPLMHARASALY